MSNAAEPPAEKGDLSGAVKRFRVALSRHLLHGVHPAFDRDPGWCRWLAEVEDGAHRGGVGDEGHDAHSATTVGAAEREPFTDAGE